MAWAQATALFALRAGFTSSLMVNCWAQFLASLLSRLPQGVLSNVLFCDSHWEMLGAVSGAASLADTKQLVER